MIIKVMVLSSATPFVNADRVTETVGVVQGFGSGIHPIVAPACSCTMSEPWLAALALALVLLLAIGGPGGKGVGSTDRCAN